MNLLGSIIYFEFATAFIALISYKKYRQSFFKYFVAYVIVLFWSKKKVN